MKFLAVAIVSILSLGAQVLSAPIASVTTPAVSPLHKALTQLQTTLKADLEAIGSTPENGPQGSNVPAIEQHFEDIVHAIHVAGHQIKTVVNDRDAAELTPEQVQMLLADLEIVQTMARNTTSTCDNAEGNYSSGTASLLKPKVIAVKAAISPFVAPLVTYATHVAEAFTGPAGLAAELQFAISDLKTLL